MPSHTSEHEVVSELEILGGRMDVTGAYLQKFYLKKSYLKKLGSTVPKATNIDIPSIARPRATQASSSGFIMAPVVFFVLSLRCISDCILGLDWAVRYRVLSDIVL